MSYKLTRELEQLPDQIGAHEAEIARLNETMAAPGFFDDKAGAQETVDRLAGVQRELDAAYARWSELEEMAGG